MILLPTSKSNLINPQDRYIFKILLNIVYFSFFPELTRNRTHSLRLLTRERTKEPACAVQVFLKVKQIKYIRSVLPNVIITNQSLQQGRKAKHQLSPPPLPGLQGDAGERHGGRRSLTSQELGAVVARTPYCACSRLPGAAWHSAHARAWVGLTGSGVCAVGEWRWWRES